MKLRRIAIALVIRGVVLFAPAFAWSENGHQTGGGIAAILIQGTRAESQVKAILGSVGHRLPVLLIGRHGFVS